MRPSQIESEANFPKNQIAFKLVTICKILFLKLQSYKESDAAFNKQTRILRLQVIHPEASPSDDTITSLTHTSNSAHLYNTSPRTA